MSARIIRFPVERRHRRMALASGAPERRAAPAIVGPKYHRTRDLDAREIAALVRADLRADPLLRQHDVTASVRLRRAADGTAIDVQLMMPSTARERDRETRLGASMRLHAEAIRAAYGFESGTEMRYYGTTTWEEEQS